MSTKRIAIIGNGRYGKFFKDFFEKRGCEVRVSDTGHIPDNKTVVKNEEVVLWAEVVLIAVTVLQTVRVIESLALLLREEQLVMDVTSTKWYPVNAMLASKAEVVGLHPFTAPPKSDSFKGQTIFVYFARVLNWRPWVDEFLTATEALIDEVDSDRHDLERTLDQGLEHMCTLLKALVMKRLGVDAARLFKVASPVYKMTAAQMGRMFAQDASLYGGLPMLNPHMMPTLGLFREEFERYARIVESKDEDAYGALFNAASGHIGPENIGASFTLSEALVKTMIDMGKTVQK